MISNGGHELPKMRVSLIVAMDEEQGIGRDNQLPWRLSTDQRRFKDGTINCPGGSRPTSVDLKRSPWAIIF
jgi:dihydrofolate reductase